DTAVLENNLYGVDINEESVEIAQLSLWLKTAKRGRKLTDLSKHIKCGDSLIDDPEIAGVKAFDWNEEFPEIMKNGGFDVVIGNPPYVLCQPSNTNIEILEFYKTFEVAGYKIDLFHLFFEKSINLLKSKGLLGFISPNTFMTNKYINKLRAFILSNCDIQNIITFNKDVFNDASVDVSTTILRKDRSIQNEIQIFKMSNSGILSESIIKSQKEWESDIDNIFNIEQSFIYDSKNCKELGELSSVTFGLQTKDKKTFVKKSRIDIDWENCYTGKDVNRYYLSPSTLFFKNNKEIVKAGGSWDMNIHHSPKIVVRQIGNPEPIFAFDQFSFATLNTMYSIVTKTDMVSSKYLLSILNSTFLKKFWKHNFLDNKQLFPKIKGYQLKKIPIKIISKSSQQRFIEKAELMLSLNKQKHEQINKFLHRFETNFKIEKLSNKIKAFYDYDFITLISELKKKKIKLTLSQQDEWEEYFNTFKEKINQLQNQIDKTDKEIDQMVYELYGLTKEEIEIIEKR
ncbi:MAG: restriction endonuclease subunit M, partial [Candidatus Cloacimonadota bacterium]